MCLYDVLLFSYTRATHWSYKGVPLKKQVIEGPSTLTLIRVRVGLDYDEEVHWLVKNHHPRQGLIEVTFDMADPMEENKIKETSTWNYAEIKFISRGFEIVHKTWPPKTPPT